MIETRRDGDGYEIAWVDADGRTTIAWVASGYDTDAQALARGLRQAALWLERRAAMLCDVRTGRLTLQDARDAIAQQGGAQ